MDTKTASISLSQDNENKPKRKYPRYVKEQNDCTWCGHFANLIEAKISGTQLDTVEMWYLCKNKHCDHFWYFQKEHKWCIVICGPNVVQQFKSYQKDPTNFSDMLKVSGEA
jgi:hypothetical protein